MSAAKRRASDYGPDHRLRSMHASDGTILRPADIIIETVPDPEAPKTAATIRRGRVRDPVRAIVVAGAPYRLLLAAERFRRDIERAKGASPPSQLRPRIVRGNGDSPEPGRALIAQRRVAEAHQAVGLLFAGIMSWCVIPKDSAHGHTFGTLDGYAECKGMRRQRAADMLRAALSRLADHYGLGDHETPRDLRLTREG